MKTLIIFAFITTSSFGSEGFYFTSSDSVCGLHASAAQENRAFAEATELAIEECQREGFTGATLEEVNIRVTPFSWGTIGCTPISRMSVSALRSCY